MKNKKHFNQTQIAMRKWGRGRVITSIVVGSILLPGRKYRILQTLIICLCHTSNVLERI